MLKKAGKYFDLRDALVFGGLGLVGYGAWLIYQPAAPIVVGSGLFFIGMAVRR